MLSLSAHVASCSLVILTPPVSLSFPQFARALPLRVRFLWPLWPLWLLFWPQSPFNKLIVTALHFCRF